MKVHPFYQLASIIFVVIAFITVAPAQQQQQQNRETGDAIVIVTKGQLGFRYRGTFYPVGMASEDLVRLLGKPDSTLDESVLRYHERRLDIHVDRNRKATTFGFRVRRPAVPNDEP